MLHRKATSGNEYTEAYKLQVFQIWYARGKPTAKHLMGLMEADPIRGDKPSYETLNGWIFQEFAPHAEQLDAEVVHRMEALAVEEKVAMLRKHTEIAIEMQEMALKYLREHQNDLKVPNAVRLLVAGIEGERASRGIPQALEKMIDLSDEQLVKQLTDLVVSGSVEIEPIEDE